MDRLQHTNSKQFWCFPVFFFRDLIWVFNLKAEEAEWPCFQLFLVPKVEVFIEKRRQDKTGNKNGKWRPVWICFFFFMYCSYRKQKLNSETVFEKSESVNISKSYWICIILQINLKLAHVFLSEIILWNSIVDHEIKIFLKIVGKIIRQLQNFKE